MEKICEQCGTETGYRFLLLCDDCDEYDRSGQKSEQTYKETYNEKVKEILWEYISEKDYDEIFKRLDKIQSSSSISIPKLELFYYQSAVLVLRDLIDGDLIDEHMLDTYENTYKKNKKLLEAMWKAIDTLERSNNEEEK